MKSYLNSVWFSLDSFSKSLFPPKYMIKTCYSGKHSSCSTLLEKICYNQNLFEELRSWSLTSFEGLNSFDLGLKKNVSIIFSLNDYTETWNIFSLSGNKRWTLFSTSKRETFRLSTPKVPRISGNVVVRCHPQNNKIVQPNQQKAS